MTPTASPKAFTLIEVMMASTILVVSFSAIITAVSRGAEMIDTARKQQIAQQIIEGEIAFQRTSPWDWSAGQSGILEMVNSPYGITVNDTGTAVINDSANDHHHFVLDNNPALMGQAQGFTCRTQATNLRVSGTPMLAITWTVSWTSSSGRVHTRTGVSHLAPNGLHLSYQR